jgi:hypothetical protein
MGIFLRDAQEATTPTPDAYPARNRARAVPWNTQRGLTASAEKINLATLTNVSRPYASWQKEAWVGYERVGEVHYGFNLLANLLSRVRIYAAAIGEANEAPADVTQKVGKDRLNSKLAKDAAKVMAELQKADFASQVRSFSLNLSVAGECYLINMPGRYGSTWVIRSVDEVQLRPGGAVIVNTRTGNQELTTLPPNTYLARIWRPNPHFSREPDSSMVGVADSIEELLMLMRLVRGAARSRMNAGLLFVPDGIAGAQSATTTAEPVLEEPADPMTALAAASTVDPSGPFMAQLMEAMTTPIADESSVSGVVPFVATGPGELGAMIKHVTFERTSDEWLVKRIEAALERVLQGIDIPKEIVTGLESVKYSNAVVIDENLYKSNIEPLALAFVDALTEVYLRPVLRGSDYGYSDEDLAKLVVWYDPSEIVTRPNSANEANEGVDRLMLSPAAWRREHGYAESDAPDEDQIALMLIHKMTALPDAVVLKLLQQALPKILDDVELPTAQPQQRASDDPNVVQFPGGQAPAKAPADPQATAVKQVGQK